MRSLRVFGVKLSLGADDLGFPGLFGFGLRSVWVVFCFVFLLATYDVVLPPCEGGQVFTAQDTIYFILGVVVTVVSTVLFALIAWVAHQGTIVEHEKRQSMPLLVHLLVLVYVVQLGVNLYGTYVLVEWPAAVPQCAVLAEQRLSILVFSVVWVYLDTLVFFIFAYFSMNRNKVKSDLKENEMTEYEMKTLQWAVG